MKRITPRPYSDDESRWRAIETRNPLADGEFCFSVRTTGVYCRPSCPARRPNRANVRYHATSADAEKAGFRACKRCRPNGTSLAERNLAAIVRACRLIENSNRLPSLAMLARAANLSPYYFHRVFKMATGVTPKTYAADHRARVMRHELNHQQSIQSATLAAGHHGNGQFFANSRRRLGMSPATYRAKGAGMIIQFAIGQSSLGQVLVAATEAGICSIHLGDRATRMVSELQRQFPNAVVRKADESFSAFMQRAIDLVERPYLELNLPLDIRGTAFQIRVWRELCQIPMGETASYGVIARSVGCPKASRAVAQACAANPIAVAIPCHRVVRSDGKISGYRWGADQKKELLARERQGRSNTPHPK